jgi:O-glycosyl hydrolase
MKKMKHVVAGVALGLSVAATSAHAVDVKVDGSQQYQTIAGFGTCLISWVPKMAKWYQEPRASETYAQTLRFNILRCNLWGAGTIGEMPVDQISYKDPNFAKDDPRTPVFIQFAKAIRKINPDVKIIGTVWSPPAWMKMNKSITDKASGAINAENYLNKKTKTDMTNRVDPKYYPEFVKWVVEMAKYYKAHGAPLYAISPANEPQFTQSFESCVWDAKDLATIIGMLGAELEKEGMGDIKIFAPETMTGYNWQGGPNQLYLEAIKANPQAWKYFDIFASHGYANGFTQDVSKNSSAQAWAVAKPYGKPYWTTEGGTGGHEWPQPIKGGGVGPALHNALVAGHASAFVPWQYAEDSRSEHNLMPLEGPDQKTWTVWQFSHFIPAGAVRVEATPEFGGINVSAYVHDKDLTIVLINPSDQEQPVTLALSNVPAVQSLEQYRTSATEGGKDVGPLKVTGGAATFTMPASCIMTLSTVK